MGRSIVGLALVLPLLLGGCMTRLYEVVDAPVSNVGNLADVGTAISRAARFQGWELEETDPGRIIAMKTRGRHSVMVNITYDVERFSITYRGSRELLYDGRRGRVQYNQWVEALQSSIVAELAER